ncbi:helix-turn-helix domain-containing protein [Halobacterium zhouii]|uniref:helix-turn-helix domain-containing protein n=1 Tax=Halobacterium zhouii TaxID=2902624 RepID=UPI001E54726E|nr:helix-turn-helix domain-containing protein [Halobacterium zhouii]
MTTSEQNTSASTALQEAGASTVDIFDALADPHRRVVLSHLDEHDGPLPMERVADRLAQWESDEQADESLDEQSREFYLALYHVHVPKLVDAGLVERDEDAGTISLVDECDEILVELDLSTSE